MFAEGGDGVAGCFGQVAGELGGPEFVGPLFQSLPQGTADAKVSHRGLNHQQIKREDPVLAIPRGGIGGPPGFGSQTGNADGREGILGDAQLVPG